MRGTGFLHFTKGEVQRMPEEFASHCCEEGNMAHIAKIIENAQTTYRVTYKRHGYNIEVSAATIPDAKKEFITAAFAQI